MDGPNTPRAHDSEDSASERALEQRASGAGAARDRERSAPPRSSGESGSADGAGAPSVSGGSPHVGWAAEALLVTAVVGVVAKLLGVMIAPGMRGVVSQAAIERSELVSATLGYTYVGLLVALILGGSFELARVRKIGKVPRGAAIVLACLAIALASPAVVQRLPAPAALALAVVTSVLAMIASLTTARGKQTRIVGATVGLLALAGLLRPFAWQIMAVAAERANLALYDTGRYLTMGALVLQALATMLAAAWLGTRSAIRGRLLANAAIALAFFLTYLAAYDGSIPPSTLRAILHGSLVQATLFPLPEGLASVSAFLIPATTLLALVAVIQRAQSRVVIAALAFALLSHGAFDVPLNALAIACAAQWGMLAIADERSMWAALVRERELVAPKVDASGAKRTA